MGIGQSSAKTDRGNQLAGINAAWNIYNRGLPFADTSTEAGTAGVKEGQATMSSGLRTLDDAKRYWQAVLSGDRTAVMRSAQPAITAVTEMSDAQRRELAETGTARSGGTAATSQEAETERMRQVSDIIAKQQPQAAEGIADVARTEAGIGGIQADVGSRQLSQALQALGLSSDVAAEIINSSITSRPISEKANSAVRQQWSNFLAALGF